MVTDAGGRAETGGSVMSARHAESATPVEARLASFMNPLRESVCDMSV
jgi:hypothetical protein